MPDKKTEKVPMRTGQKIPLTIKRLGINGEGVGFFKRTVVFVPGALPGEEIVAVVDKVFPNRAEAKLTKIRKPSKDRVEPPCPVFGECGGCQIQHLSYAGQLKEKEDLVRQAFERYTKIPADQLPLEPAIGMDVPWKYRNKSQFQLARDNEQIIAGLYKMNSHQVLNLDECPVQHEDTTSITNKVKRILSDLNLPVYNEKKRKGVFRTIVVRTAFETDEKQLVLVTATKELPKKDLLIEEIKRRIPEATSVIHNVNPEKTSLIFGEETTVLMGDESITEHLGELSFDLSARAFFQLNPKQTVKLYDEVKKQARLTGKEKIVDAYCGSGTIGLWLAPLASEIRGMDVIKESIEDAKLNARKHGFSHAHYSVGKAESLLPKWLKEGFKPDIVVVDPPRTGCETSFLETAARIKPKRMVYVSCNPSTLAKDVHLLISKGFEVEKITPVDMFPQTAHVEAVCTLVWKR